METAQFRLRYYGYTPHHRMLRYRKILKPKNISLPPPQRVSESDTLDDEKRNLSDPKPDIYLLAAEWKGKMVPPRSG